MQPLLDLNIVAIKTQIRQEDIDNAKIALLRSAEPLKTFQNRKEDCVAIVGYGPSLRETWEQVKKFEYIITTSGAHDFLVERGCEPLWHVECDPRIHKAKFSEHPTEYTAYLIGSTAHPKIWTNLMDQHRYRWHFDVLRPHLDLTNETVLPTYGDVGQQAIYIAKYLGFKDIHVFGFDYSYGPDNTCHAGEHGNELKEGVGILKGTNFKTHIELIKNLKFFDILMEENQDVSLTIYGNGLLSHYLEAKHNELSTR